jgi:hypothetical protein
MAHERIKSSVIHARFPITRDMIGSDYGERNIGNLLIYANAMIRLLSDAPYDAKPIAVYKAFYKMLRTCDLRLFIIHCSDLYSELLTIRHTTGPIRASLSADSFTFAKKLPVFREILSYVENGDGKLLRYLGTFLTFGKKMVYEDEEFNARAFRSWQSVEDKLKLHTFDAELTARLKKVVSFLLDCVWPDVPASGKFGPGTVSDTGKTREIKSRTFVSYGPLAFAMKRTWMYESAFPGYGFDYDRCVPSRNESNDTRYTTSELLFVPKNAKTARTICREPNAYMFWQQHFARVMTESINSSRIGRFISIHDQEPSRSFAEYGSWSMNIDTIDLSAASDSVSLRLVKAIMPRPVLWYLLATRSRYVRLPDGRTVRVEKFAPMGSALCFPTQCVIFSAICFMAYHEHRLNGYTHDDSYDPRCLHETLDMIGSLGVIAREPLTKTYEPFRVYGDDIACDSRVTRRVLQLLEAFGFAPNEEKSFTGSQSFRESCGGFYLEGVDVTPVQHRFGECHNGTMSIRGAASLIELRNALSSTGLTIAASYFTALLRMHPFRGVVKQNGMNPFLYSDDPNVGMVIIVAKPNNTHLRKRDNIALQRCEVESVTVGTVTRRVKFSNAFHWYTYHEWWRARNVGAFLDAVPASHQRLTLDIVSKRRWTPAY